MDQEAFTRIPYEWLKKHGLAIVRPKPDLEILDVRGVAVIERPRVLMAPWLLANGLPDLATIIPIGPSDPDLQTVLASYGLHCAPEASAADELRHAHVVKTGGIVRGFETGSADMSR